MNLILILIGKLLSMVSRFLNVGSGSTWPGHIALSINSNFIKDILGNQKIKIILIAGTNGKTTTTKLIKTILEKSGNSVLENTSGANLLNGIASIIVSNSNTTEKINKDYAIFEIDENTLPLILKEIPNPDFVLLLNLFRDQLDRYGEVNTISKKWEEALRKLSSKTNLILNADDPQIAYLALHLKGANVKYFGVDPKNKTDKSQHASDSTYCPNCDEKLTYNLTYFSHLGDWECKKCGYKHPAKTFTKSPAYPLVGTYNDYNTNAAALLASEIGIDKKTIISAFKNFRPAFGRQEILNINGKKVQIFLSKNPTGFNESLKTISSLKAPARHASQGVAGGKNLLVVLNDRIPDGLDVSWIWDVDFENFIYSFKNITISGERLYDMGLRIKYAQTKTDDLAFTVEENLKKAIKLSLDKIPKDETLYILPTYSAMLEIRKILTGKKIL